jgi:hypothetical protein
MRVSTFQQVFLKLALLAATLLAVAPTAGRLLSAEGAGARWVELCTAQGSALVPFDAGDEGGPATAHGGEDCPYCPLGAQLLIARVPAWTAAPGADLWLALPDAPGEPAFPYPRGLGSRGPPAHS